MMNKNKFCIVYNPISGSGGSIKIVKKIERDFNNSSIKYHIFQSEYKGHIKKYCQNCIDYTQFLIIGGDGTFHEAVNGFLKNVNLKLITVGFFPGGTGNSFMYDLNAITYAQAYNKIINGRVKKIDILQLKFNDNIEYAFNIVGWGLVSDINILAEKLRFLGSQRYNIASLYYIFNRNLQSAELIIDGKSRKDKYLFIMCLNTIHTGKAMKAAPRALLDDGLLDLVLLESKISTLKLIILLTKIFKGTHIHSKYVKYIQAKSITIKPKTNSILNIDGENKLKTPIKISVLPKVFKIFY